MWVIEGAFDGDGVHTTADNSRKKLKLLKPGRCYPLGRKAKHPLQLVINNPKVSGEHVSFIVGECPIQSVDDISFKPKLSLLNHKSKAIQVNRETEDEGSSGRFLVPASAENELSDGDVVAVVTGLYVRIYWRPVCCLLPPQTREISFERCASLGIKVVSSHLPGITHHLISTVSESTSVAISLLTPAFLVRPEWLSELLHLGTNASDPEGLSSLEKDFQLPAFSRYRPATDSSIPSPLKAAALWEPNEKRVGMLKNKRFIFAGPNGRELDTEMRMLVERGESEYETYDITGGVLRWKQLLTRNVNKASENGKEIVVIGDTGTLQLSAEDTWSEICSILRSFKLNFIPRSQLLDAIFFVDISRLDSSSTSLNSGDQGTIGGYVTQSTLTLNHGAQEELDIENVDSSSSVLAKRKRPRKRITEASQSTTPMNDYSGAESAVHKRARIDKPSANYSHATPVPRESATAERASIEPDVVGTSGRKKPLVRRARANATPLILGVDDPSLSSITPSQIPAPDDHIEQPTPSSVEALSGQVSVAKKPPSATGRPGKLKKRARTDASSNLIPPSLEDHKRYGAQVIEEESPLKRYKDLFDETDPDRDVSQFSSGIAESQFPATFDSVNIQDRLSSIPEESQNLEADNPENGDGVMEILPDSSENIEKNVSNHEEHPPGVNEHKPPVTVHNNQKIGSMSRTASSKKGAPPGCPDTDEAFLQALASSRRGKRTEDDFDREFNNLKISRPDLDQEERDPAEDWKILADFGDDFDIRGNFMVIVEMDIPDKTKNKLQSVGPRAVRADWHKKPDFKKFKKKVTSRRMPAVELVLDKKYIEQQQKDEDELSIFDFPEPKVAEPLREVTKLQTTPPIRISPDDQIRNAVAIEAPRSATSQKSNSQSSQSINKDRDTPEDMYLTEEIVLEKSQQEGVALFLPDDEEVEKVSSGNHTPEDVDLDEPVGGEEVDDAEPSTLRSSGPVISETSANAESTMEAPKKRKHVLLDALFDSEDGGSDEDSYRSHSGSKRMRVE